MKPGNLREIRVVPNPAATTDEDSIERTSNARCAVFLVDFSNASPTVRQIICASLLFLLNFEKEG